MTTGISRVDHDRQSMLRLQLPERLLQELIGAEATPEIGAEWGEHTDTRATWRNGHREKTVTTQAGNPGGHVPPRSACTTWRDTTRHLGDWSGRRESGSSASMTAYTGESGKG
jgi:hypothetical protein